jgi:hypothetical protein
MNECVDERISNNILFGSKMKKSEIGLACGAYGEVQSDLKFLSVES